MRAGTRMAFIAMLVFSLYAHAASGVPNISGDISSTSAYVNTINQSGYLVFYPNLTASYKYISEAGNQSNNTDAYALLLKARANALSQQERIDSYKQVSLYLLFGALITLAALLFIFMRKPSKS